MPRWNPMTQTWEPTWDEIQGSRAVTQADLQRMPSNALDGLRVNNNVRRPTIGVSRGGPSATVRVVQPRPIGERIAQARAAGKPTGDPIVDMLAGVSQSQLQQQAQLKSQNEQNAARAMDILLGRGGPSLEQMSSAKDATLKVDKRSNDDVFLDTLQRMAHETGYRAPQLLDVFKQSEKIRRASEQQFDKQGNPIIDTSTPEEDIIHLNESEESKKSRERQKDAQERANKEILDRLEAQLDAEIEQGLYNPNDKRKASEIVNTAYGRIDPQAMLYMGSKAVQAKQNTELNYRKLEEERKAEEKAKKHGPGDFAVGLLKGMTVDPAVNLYKANFGTPEEKAAAQRPATEPGGLFSDYRADGTKKSGFEQLLDASSIALPTAGNAVSSRSLSKVSSGTATAASVAKTGKVKGAPLTTTKAPVSIGNVEVELLPSRTSMQTSGRTAGGKANVKKQVSAGGDHTMPDVVGERGVGKTSHQLEAEADYAHKLRADFVRNVRAEVKKKLLDPLKQFDKQFARGYDPAKEYIITRDKSVLKDLNAAQRKKVKELAKANDDLAKSFHGLAEEQGIRLGYKKGLGKIEGYAPVAERKNVFQRILDEVNQPPGVTDDVAGVSSKSSFRKTRTKDPKGDLDLGYQKYIDELAHDLYLKPMGAKYRSFAEKVHKKGGDGALVRALRNKAEGLEGTGVTHGITGIKKHEPNTLTRILNAIVAQNSSASLGLNPRSTLMQTVGGFKAVGKHPIAALQSIGKEANPIASRFLGAYADHIPALSRTKWQTGRDIGFSPIGKAVKATGNLQDRVYTQVARNKGMTNEEARRFADRMIKRDIGSRLAGDRAAIFNNPNWAPITQFGLEASNDLTQFGSAIRNKDLQSILGLSAGLYGFNSGANVLFGDRPAFDPANMTIEAVKDIKDGRPGRAALQVLGNIIPNRPGGAAAMSAVTRGMGIDEQEAKELFGRSQFGRYGGGSPLNAFTRGFNFDYKDKSLQANVGKGLRDLVLRAGLPTGGGQAIKMLDAAKMLKDDKYVSAKGNELPVNVDTSPLGVLQTMLFGKSANKGVREYFDQVNKGGFGSVVDPKKMEAVNKFINDKKKTSGDKDLQFSDEDKRYLAKYVDDKGNLYDPDYLQRKNADSTDPLERFAISKALMLGGKIPMSAVKDTELDVRYSNGEIGNAEYTIEKSKNQGKKIDEQLIGAEGMSTKDIVYLKSNGLNSEFTQDYIRGLRGRFGDEYADAAVSAIRGYNEDAGRAGSPYLNTEVRRYTANQETQELAAASRYSPDVVALAKASADDRANVIKNNPSLASLLPQAGQYVQRRADEGLISQKSARSTQKALQKLLSGDMSVGGSTGSGGGRKGRRSGGRRGGRKGSRGRSGSIKIPKPKKGRAGKKPSLKKFAPQKAFTLPSSRTKQLSFEQILRQLSR